MIRVLKERLQTRGMSGSENKPELEGTGSPGDPELRVEDGGRVSRLLYCSSRGSEGGYCRGPVTMAVHPGCGGSRLWTVASCKSTPSPGEASCPPRPQAQGLVCGDREPWSVSPGTGVLPRGDCTPQGHWVTFAVSVGCFNLWEAGGCVLWHFGSSVARGPRVAPPPPGAEVEKACPLPNFPLSRMLETGLLPGCCRGW